MMKHYEFEDEYREVILPFDRLSEWMDREYEFQRSLSPRDARHWSMFNFEEEDGEQFVLIYWGGYEYSYEVSRISRPEDLLWLIVHLSEKEWEHTTGYRIAALMKAIAHRKGWQPYKKAPHPNEAPCANHDKAAERAKMTHTLRYEVIKRDAHRCRSCGASVADGASLHVDHIVAVAKGGRTNLGNLQTLCTSCNIGKAHR